MDIEKYSQEIITRFLNPEIQHRLAQIAWDGSQKIQMRILPVIRDNLAAQRSIQGLCMALASWFEFICRALTSGHEINDPLANVFSQMPALREDNPAVVVESFLSIDAIFANDLRNNPLVTQQLTRCLRRLRDCAEAGQSVADALTLIPPASE
jgi:fructuronate reductase